MDAHHRAHHQLSITVPRVNQKDLPIFDDVDRIPYTNQITYGITQRLMGKPEKEGVSSGPYEYAKLKIFQTYSLGDPFNGIQKGREEYFSNIQAELWWNFSPYIYCAMGVRVQSLSREVSMYGMPHYCQGSEERCDSNPISIYQGQYQRGQSGRPGEDDQTSLSLWGDPL